MNCSHTFAILYTCYCYPHIHFFNALRGNFRETDCEIYFYVHNVCSLLHIAHTSGGNTAQRATDLFSIISYHPHAHRCDRPTFFAGYSNSRAESFIFSFCFALLSLHATYLYGMLQIRFVHNDFWAKTRACEWMNTRWLSNIKFQQMYCFAMNIYAENSHFGWSSFVAEDCSLQLCCVRRQCRPKKRKRRGNKRTICRRHFEARDKQTKNGFSKWRGKHVQKNIHCFR